MYVSADQMPSVIFNVTSCFCCAFVYLIVLWLLSAGVRQPLFWSMGEGWLPWKRRRPPWLTLTSSCAYHQCWNWPKELGSDVETFEILHRDWNLKPIFTQKWVSVNMNLGVNQPTPRQFQHCISPHHSHGLRSHHLSFSRPFTPDLKLISFAIPFPP